MDSRPILKDTKEIKVFIDSKTFDCLLEKKDRLAAAILRHYDSDLLDFIRNPLKTDFEELKNIVEYKLDLDKDLRINSIKITKKEYRVSMAFGYRGEDILSITKKVCKKDKVSREELDKITTVFIQAVFNRFEKSNIYITDDELLLKNRLWFESHFPGYPLNIMSVEEASLFLDLFFKKNEKYFSSSRYTLNKGHWYWLSMRLKLPHFNVGDPMIGALAHRMYYSLMALDEMGIQYYLGVNNDTMDNTLYHFNYLISLFTGIFDNLALKTNSQLGINFTDLRKVSIHNKSGKEFLKEIREKNQDIRDHITSYVEFINLIYLFRELVIHREGLAKTGFEDRSDNGKWKANFVKVTKDIKEKLTACGDQKNKYDPFTKWGFYQLYTGYFLDPYNFSLEAIKKLVIFVEKYLELLGCSSFIKSQKQKKGDFTTTLNFFEKHHLGF